MLVSKACKPEKCPSFMAETTHSKSGCEPEVMCCGKCITCDSPIIAQTWKGLGGYPLNKSGDKAPKPKNWYGMDDFVGCNSVMYRFRKDGQDHNYDNYFS